MIEKLRIAELKEQHWQYGIESQLQWMKDNIISNDYHLMGEEVDGEVVSLRAYISIIQLNIKIDGEIYDALGIGGVCVDKSIEHSGYGKLLVREACKYIISKGKTGILLCNDELKNFYEKCGWNQLIFERAEVAGIRYFNNIMLLFGVCKCSLITINRNF